MELFKKINNNVAPALPCAADDAGQAPELRQCHGCHVHHYAPGVSRYLHLCTADRPFFAGHLRLDLQPGRAAVPDHAYPPCLRGAQHNLKPNTFDLFRIVTRTQLAGRHPDHRAQSGAALQAEPEQHCCARWFWVTFVFGISAPGARGWRV